MVYSTCTITLEENEEQISWLVNKYKNMTIVDQEPFHLSNRNGLKFKQIDLSSEQLNRLQRFMPNHLLSDQKKEMDYEGYLNDSNGFFIAKLYKNKE